ncbi:Heat shock cognate 71 kDa protein [Armadillidium vulgare]|nr:Heat shock cognate 71 kDa protein [Armadillidium vulgare]
MDYVREWAAVGAKIALSSSSEASVHVKSLYEDVDFNSSITCAHFEKLCDDLFFRTIITVEKCMRDAKIPKHHVQNIILVGGSIHIPKIQELLQDFFNGKELSSFTSEDAVVCGASVIADFLCGKFDISIRDNQRCLSIKIEFYIDADGILNITADKSGHTEDIAISFDKGQLSLEDIERMEQEVENYKVEEEKINEQNMVKMSLEFYSLTTKSIVEDGRLKENIGRRKKPLLY